MENTITTSNFENKLKERFSADRNRIVNFIKENFNVEEIIKIDEDDTWDNMYVKVKYRYNIERSIHECECVAEQIDEYERPWVVRILNKYKDKALIMATIWACYNGITADEIFEMVNE